MHEIELPLIEPDIAVDQALRIMIRDGRSGLVTTHDDNHIVFTFEELVEQLRESGNKPLSALAPTTRTVDTAKTVVLRRSMRMPDLPVTDVDVQRDRQRAGGFCRECLISNGNWTSAANILPILRLISTLPILTSTTPTRV
jgi:CBS domain-containing protein